MLVGALADAGADPDRHRRRAGVARNGRGDFVRKGETLRHRRHQVPRRGAGNARPPASVAHREDDRKGRAARRAPRHNAVGRVPAAGRSGSGGAPGARSRRFISTKWARPIPSPISSARAWPSTCSASIPSSARRSTWAAARCKPSTAYCRCPRRPPRGCCEDTPIYARGPAVELTTPTGAAVASRWRERFGALPPMKIAAHRLRRGRPRFSATRQRAAGDSRRSRPAPRKRSRSRCSKPISTISARRCWPTPWSACWKPARSTSRCSRSS